MMKRRLQLFALFACTTLAACVGSSPPKIDSLAKADSSSSPTAADIGKMDLTMGSYGAGREEQLILVTMNNDVHEQLLSNTPNSASHLIEADLPVPFRSFLSDLHQRFGIKRVADWPLDSLAIRCLVFESDGSQSIDEIVNALNQESNIDTAQIMQLFSTKASGYNDPFIPIQHSFQTMRVEPSHRWSTGLDVVVGVIDTGIDQQHQDIRQSIKTTFDFVDKADNGTHDDEHGTAIAGIISAATDNAAGMAGIAPDAKIIALKACWNRAQDKGAICNSFTLAKGLNVAIRNKVDIINLSLSGPRDALLERLIEKAIAENIIVIGARDPVDKDLFPAAIKEVVAAGLPGDTTQSTIAAPGSRIISTAPGNRYDFYSGSSFSTAHLTGVAALLRQLNPDLSPAAVRRMLSESNAAGPGPINVCNLITTMIEVDNKDCSSESALKDS